MLASFAICTLVVLINHFSETGPSLELQALALGREHSELCALSKVLIMQLRHAILVSYPWCSLRAAAL